MNHPIDYENDFSAWALYNAQLLREGKFAELDVEHLIEELEDMGNNRPELANCFIILIAHLLKWEYQPDNRSSSWQGSINEPRVRISRLLRNKPSLKPSLLNAIVDAYSDAVELASDDTGLAKSTFPTTCPYSLEQLLEKRFFP